ncbi:MAG TPA: GH92 family glycosyl hydrolase [Ktedonobacterales bacterium]|nr:GH92 family glycosyl hydrolase [Ktedonobacterales bacterium]
MADDEADVADTAGTAEEEPAGEAVTATATTDPGEPAVSGAVVDTPRPSSARWMGRVAGRARAITWASRRRRGLLLALLCVVIFSVVAGSASGRLKGQAKPTVRQARPTVTVQPRPTPSATPAPIMDLASDVSPFVGTQPGGLAFGYGGGGGNTFPGATLPFGMVQWSPETYPGPAASDPGGYQYSDGAIRDFSMTHLSGAGCRILGDAPFMPTTLPITDAPTNDPGRYSASFAHADETAAPGAYSVRLGTGIQVELTATTRTGLARIQFPAGQPENLLVASGTDLGGVSDAHAQIVNPTEIAGSVKSGHFCGYLQTAYTVYFAAQFSRPATGYGAWQGGGVAPGVTAASGSGSGLYLSFTPASDPLLVKVGVSYVSSANALANLAAENPGWDFDATRAAARATWDALLNHVVVTGGSADEERTFYTALYHTLLQPNTFSDANGQYIGLDNQTHVAAGYVQYANFSGWDVYRTQIPLIALLAPSETSDMMQSLVADGEQGGALPRWDLANMDTGIMVGDPLTAALADGYAFGARDFDTEAALRVMLAGAGDPGIGVGVDVERPGLASYLAEGYVADEYAYASAATSLEYYSEDYAIASFAWYTHHPDVARNLAARAANWVKLYNPAIGYFEPRNADGTWVRSPGGSADYGFVEGDAAQYTWMLPFDVAGLARRMGGPAAAIQRLNDFFTNLNAGAYAPYAFLGNEVSLCAPWEYDYLGQPWQTQATVRRALTQLYGDTPAAMPGNDDLGALSAWYVWGALGLYPETPGLSGFALGSPLFPQATLTIGGATVQIDAPGANAGTPYVSGLTVDGASYASLWLPFGTLAHAHDLDFALGAKPDTTWDTAPADAPPSLSTWTWPPVAPPPPTHEA